MKTFNTIVEFNTWYDAQSAKLLAGQRIVITKRQERLDGSIRIEYKLTWPDGYAE